MAECSKRDVGRPLYHKTIGGKQYPPQVIEAFVLHKLHTDAARQIGPFGSVVITVPAYFDESRRKATQDAGYIAGFEVLDIINEPTAAAVAFGFQRGYLDPQGSSLAPQHVLVYDLGGGTFDVTVMQIRGTEFNALATDGDVRLGGYDWDMRLLNLVAERFAADCGLDPRDDPLAAGRLRLACEDAKRTLSARQKAAVTCDCHGTTARSRLPGSSSSRPRPISWTGRGSRPCRRCGRQGSIGRNSIACSWSAARRGCPWSARCSASLPARSPTTRWPPTRRSPTGLRCTPR